MYVFPQNTGKKHQKQKDKTNSRCQFKQQQKYKTIKNTVRNHSSLGRGKKKAECHWGKNHQLNCRWSVILARTEKRGERSVSSPSPLPHCPLGCSRTWVRNLQCASSQKRRDNTRQNSGTWLRWDAKDMPTCLQDRRESGESWAPRMASHPGPLYPDACPYLSKTTWRTKT